MNEYTDDRPRAAEQNEENPLRPIARLFETGRISEGIKALNEVLLSEPNNVVALRMMGNIAEQLKQAAVVIDAFTRILDLVDPNSAIYIEALMKLARTHFNENDADIALEYIEQLLPLRPGDLGLRGFHGVLYARTGEEDKALEAFNLVVTTAMTHLKQNAVKIHDVNTAIAQSAAISSGHLPSQSGHRDELQKQQNNLRAILASYNIERAKISLKRGNLLKGFNLYVYRHEFNRVSQLVYDKKIEFWNGNDAVERRQVVITPEQDLRETLFALRYLPLLKNLKPSITAMVTPSMQRLFAHIPFVDSVVADKKIQGVPSYQIPLMDLPNIFRESPTISGQNARVSVFDWTGVAPNATDVVLDAADLAPNATDVVPDAADVAPNAADVAPNATDVVPDAADVAPNAADVAPNATDAAPKIGIAWRHERDNSPEQNTALEDWEQLFEAVASSASEDAPNQSTPLVSPTWISLLPPAFDVSLFDAGDAKTKNTPKEQDDTPENAPGHQAPTLTEGEQSILETHHIQTPAFADWFDVATQIDKCDLIIASDNNVAHLAAALKKPVWVLTTIDESWWWISQRNLDNFKPKPRDGTSADDTSADDTNTNGTNTNGTNTNGTNTNGTNTNDTSADDTSADDTNTNGTNTNDTSADDTSADDTSAGYTTLFSNSLSASSGFYPTAKIFNQPIYKEWAEVFDHVENALQSFVAQHKQ